MIHFGHVWNDPKSLSNSDSGVTNLIDSPLIVSAPISAVRFRVLRQQQVDG